ncbi:MAG: penicillin-binding protein 2 [Gammaproteobacteria bacterium]|jgi:penicillin-binding protein 2|nr:penicillin-binding protein 2 [Gammaproteobacteria bacterium]
MFYRTLIKDHLYEIRVFQQRALVASVIVVFMVTVLLIRLLYLQLYQHGHFKTLSESNSVRLVAIAPNRGLIYDRNGVVMAENRPSYRLVLVPEQVTDMKATLAELGKLVVLDDDTLNRFYKLLGTSRTFESVPLRTKLSEEEVARLAQDRHRFRGVEVAAQLSRYYPLGERASHIIGYVSRIDDEDLKGLDAVNYAGTNHIGKVGLEKRYEDTLHGTVGYQSIEVNAEGRELRVLDKTRPVPGKDLILSIDMDLQTAAEDALAGYNGAVVAMTPKTGEVLVMASLPGFDPNLFVHGIGFEDYNRLNTSEDRPLFNRAISGQYPPGSTIKPFMGLVGLEEKAIGAHESIFCRGYYMLAGEDRRYRDWKKEGHGHVALEQAIAQSCDVYYYELANRLGIDKMQGFLQHFGFGQVTGLDSVGERPGLLPSREWKQRARGKVWYPGETLIAGIGQGYVLTTPLQLATATSIMATRGVAARPHLVGSIRDMATGTQQDVQPELTEAVKPTRIGDWQQVVDGMVSVMHGPRGTARGSGLNLPFKMAGKTGTAQVFGVAQDKEYDELEVEKKLRDHALFIVFAPADDPQIAIGVIAENGGHGSSVAAPVARKVIDVWLQKQMYKTGEVEQNVSQ